MYFEKRRIELIDSPSGKIGHIELSKLAIPDSMKIIVSGERIFPDSFDCFGHPNFTKEQAMLFNFRESEFERNVKDREYLAEITYSTWKFDIGSRVDFDSIDGIELSLNSFADFNELLDQRKICARVYPDRPLQEFVVLGTFFLDQFGHIKLVDQPTAPKSVPKDVEFCSEFHEHAPDTTFIKFDGLPRTGTKCPLCGRKFAIDDLRGNLPILVNHKFYHKNCWSPFAKLLKIDEITDGVMGLVYNKPDYSFELIENESANGQKDYTNIPEFLFHTTDGDVVIKPNGQEFLIEWQENYKPFNFYNVFSSKNLAPRRKGQKCSVIATNKTKLYECLVLAKEAVNPKFK